MHFGKKDLNGLSFNSQSLREWVCQEGEKKWSIDACIYSYNFFFLCVFFLFLYSFFHFFLPLLPSLCSLIPLSLLIATLFYTIWHCEIYHFYPSIAFGSLQMSFQDCPLACRLPSHYLFSKCVGCTTFHFQTILLVLFLTSLRFHFTHPDKD